MKSSRRYSSGFGTLRSGCFLGAAELADSLRAVQRAIEAVFGRDLDAAALERVVELARLQRVFAAAELAEDRVGRVRRVEAEVFTFGRACNGVNACVGSRCSATA